MTEEQLQALRITIDLLDEAMKKSPNRELADHINFLENMYQENK